MLLFYKFDPVPVIITVSCEDGCSATTIDLLYIVEELYSVFIRRDALLSDLVSTLITKILYSMMDYRYMTIDYK